MTAVAPLSLKRRAHDAAKHGDWAPWLDCLTEGWSPEQAVTSRGETVLHLAVSHGHAHWLAQVLRDTPAVRAAINRPTDTGDTPLWRAVLKNDLRLVQPLLDAGATLEGSPAHSSVVGLAGQRAGLPVLEALLAASPWTAAMHEETLMTAVINGNLPVVKALLERGVSPSVRGPGSAFSGPNEWLVCRAAQSLSPQAQAVFEALLAHGADPNALALSQEPLWTVVLRRREPVGDWVRALDTHGVDWMRPDSVGRSVVYWATQPGVHERTAQAVLDQLASVHGLDMEALDPASGDRPLHAAVRHRPTLVPALLGHGARPDALNAHGQSPLGCAVRQNALGAAQALWEAGARLQEAEVSEAECAPEALAWLQAHHHAEQLAHALSALPSAGSARKPRL